MSIKVAINGFGRVGRTTFRVALERNEHQNIVAINSRAEAKVLAHLLKYDTNYGTLNNEISHTDSQLIVDGHKVKVLIVDEKKELYWEDMDIDIVIESSGKFVDDGAASVHLKAGAKRVVLAAPPKGDTINTYVLGVNGQDFSNDQIISNSSCTTNCIAPLAAIMEQNFGIQKAMMTTIHGYTSDQNLQDNSHKDLRRARAAAENIIPTSSGAAISTTEIVPKLKGLFDGLAFRVPISTVSVSDLTFLVKKKTTIEEINAAIKEAVINPIYHNILTYTEDPIVSSDIIKNPHSAVVDLLLTNVVDGDLVKVVAWYDNEWAYSNRLWEMVMKLGKTLS